MVVGHVVPVGSEVVRRTSTTPAVVVEASVSYSLTAAVLPAYFHHHHHQPHQPHQPHVESISQGVTASRMSPVSLTQLLTPIPHSTQMHWTGCVVHHQHHVIGPRMCRLSLYQVEGLLVRTCPLLLRRSRS